MQIVTKQRIPWWLRPFFAVALAVACFFVVLFGEYVEEDI